MKISVVTATYNSEKTVGYTIESFLNQTWTDAEMLIVDGLSKDGTVALAESFADPRIRIHSEKDSGIYDAFNKGLARFSGDAMGYLNSDDRYHDAHALEAIAGGLAQNDIVHGDLNFVADHETGRIVRRWRAKPWRTGGFQRGWMPAHPTLYVRRGVAERVGPFDCDLWISGDYDFMVRAIATAPAPPRIGQIGRILVDMKVGGNSTQGFRAYLEGNRQSLISRQRWLGAGPVDWAFIAKPLGKVGQFLGRG